MTCVRAREEEQGLTCTPERASPGAVVWVAPRGNMSIALRGWNLGVMGGLLALPMTLLARRLSVEAYDESRWTTDLLGRPGRGEAAGPRGLRAAADGRASESWGVSARLPAQCRRDA